MSWRTSATSSAPEVAAQFDPRSFKAFTVDDKIYAIPFIGDIGLMYYRKSMFEDAGIPIPQTWEEFVAAAKALTKDDVKGAFFGNDGGVAQAYVLRVLSPDAIVTDDKIGYNNPDVAAALTQFAQLYADDSVSPARRTDRLVRPHRPQCRPCGQSMGWSVDDARGAGGTRR